MPFEHERAFSADSPVGRYWLLHCAGFTVEGLRAGGGVVEEVGLGPDGVDMLAVRRRGPIGSLIRIPVQRVEWIRPWEDTLVLRSRRTRARERRAALAQHLSPHANRAGHAAGRALRAGGIGLARAAAALGTLLLGLAVLARKHAPRAARTLGEIASAYASEARRAWNTEREAIAAWRESRRARSEPLGDDGPITRAGADEAGARKHRLRARR